MPTYQYSCHDCGRFHEIFQSFSEDSLTVCPECGGRLRKVFNAVGVVFKGSGFYRNDSRGAKVGAENGAAARGEKNGSGKDADSGSKAAPEKTASASGSTSEAKGSTTAPTPA